MFRRDNELLYVSAGEPFQKEDQSSKQRTANDDRELTAVSNSSTNNVLF